MLKKVFTIVVYIFAGIGLFLVFGHVVGDGQDGVVRDVGVLLP